MEHFASRGLGTGEPSGRDLRRAETQAVGPNTVRAEPPKPSSFLAATKGELDSAINSLVDLNGRLGALADRMLGAKDEGNGVDRRPMLGATGGLTSEVEDRVNSIHGLVQAAHATVTRLDSL